jgi:hypothetical protein
VYPWLYPVLVVLFAVSWQAATGFELAGAGGLPLLPARRAAPAGRIKVPGAILRALTRLRIEL